MTPSTAKPPVRGRRSRRPTGDERESAIRETLERLLDDQQFHEVSIDDLARGAGISRSSFYFYFESKEAVLLSLLDEFVSQAIAASDAARAMIDQDPQRFLRDVLAAYVTILGGHRGVMVAASQAAAANSDLRKLWNGMRERWVQMAEEAIMAERRRSSLSGALSPRELAIALLAMNESVMYQVFAREQPAIEEERVIDVLTDIWINAVYEGARPAAQTAT
jgi:AcrR family transcriptional regulator